MNKSIDRFLDKYWQVMKRQRLDSGGYSTTGIIAPFRSTYRGGVRRPRANLTGRTSRAWDRRRDNKTKPRVIGVPRQIKNAVKAIIDQQAEWKTTRGLSQGTCRGTVAAADVIQFMPALSQGVSNGARVGNEINIKSAKFDILICPIGTGADSAAFKVRILVFRPQDKGNKPFDATMAASFYDNGAVAFAGTGAMIDQVAIPNPDLFEVLYDNLTPIMQWVDTVPTTGNADSLTKIPLNQYRYSIDMPYACGKLKYNENTSVDPSKYMWILLQAVNVNTLTSVNAAATTVAEYVIQGSFDYVDE